MRPTSRSNQRPAELFCDSLLMPLVLAPAQAAELKRAIVELILNVMLDDVKAPRGGECGECSE
jgi:hypothetical protein